MYAKLWTSIQFNRLSDRAKIMYIGLITLADDDGRVVGNPAYLRGQIFSYDNISLSATHKYRQEIIDAGLVILYQEGDEDYIEHPNWKEYQIIRADLYRPSSLPKRNEKVTVTEQKSYLSKDKISKDNKFSNSAGASPAEVVAVIEAFKEINPSYRKWFGNKTQRSAAERMVETHGLDRVLRVIAVLPRSNKMAYVPIVTSPVQLEEKWSALKAGLEKKQDSKRAKAVIL